MGGRSIYRNLTREIEKRMGPSLASLRGEEKKKRMIMKEEILLKNSPARERGVFSSVLLWWSEEKDDEKIPADRHEKIRFRCNITYRRGK